MEGVDHCTYLQEGDKTVCSNYSGISLLPPTYKILSNILLSRLNQYAEEIIGDYQCELQRNRSPSLHIFCIPQIIEKKWEYKKAVPQRFINFKKAYYSAKRDVLYNILTESDIHMSLVRLTKLCVTETHSRVLVGKHLSDMFPSRNGFKLAEA